MTVPTPVIEIDATTLVGSFHVEASFAVTPGITALFGPSGSGKSVTLATIAGVLRPRRGTVRLRGRLVADAQQSLHVRTQDRRVAMVFQQAALLPHRSPLDNVALAVPLTGRDNRRRQAREWLHAVGAGHLAQSRTATLSGGEQQRVALARALAGGSDIVLLDEPFSALDLETRRSLRQLVRSLVDEVGLTAVLVTHDLEDRDELADRVVRFEPGRTVANGDGSSGVGPQNATG
jgi:molybdate transport system ATP-binding protein